MSPLSYEGYQTRLRDLLLAETPALADLASLVPLGLGLRADLIFDALDVVSIQPQVPHPKI